MDNQVIEIFGMKMEVIENAHRGHNWCTMCALEPFCDKTHIESELYGIQYCYKHKLLNNE